MATETPLIRYSSLPLGDHLQLLADSLDAGELPRSADIVRASADRIEDLEEELDAARNTPVVAERDPRLDRLHDELDRMEKREERHIDALNRAANQIDALEDKLRCAVVRDQQLSTARRSEDFWPVL